MTFHRNVTLGDGPDLRHDHQFLVWDRGRWRVLDLRVAYGAVRELDFPHSLPPPPGLPAPAPVPSPAVTPAEDDEP